MEIDSAVVARTAGVRRKIAGKRKSPSSTSDHRQVGDTVSYTRSSLSDAELIALEHKHSPAIFKPFPVVFHRAEGAELIDGAGKRHLDLVGGYSVVSQGHTNPRIIKAMSTQANTLALTSRAYHNNQLLLFLQKVSQMTGFEQLLPMNSGAEAVETALKIARLHGHVKKGIKENQAEIIVFHNNFHGRTLAAVSMSSDAQYKHGFGPFLPGIIHVPYGDAAALEKAVTKNTAAIIVEPIQGEAGIIVPPRGYLQHVQALTRKYDVLFIADEIQTGLGRTGKLFAYQHEEGVKPDMILLGKALSGGMYPVSAVVSSKEIMSVLKPGSHGSTFGGNPLAAATGLAALEEFDDGRLVTNARVRGRQIISALSRIQSPLIDDVRGKGLFIGLQVKHSAHAIAQALLAERILTKDTHGYTLRIAPPLTITKKQAARIAPAFARVLKKFEKAPAS